MTVPLFKHQKDIIDYDPKKTGLFLGTGSGKTRTAVALAKGLTLVICPKTQALDNTWTNEWDLQCKNPGDLVIISKEQFKIKLKKGELDDFLPETVIIDEAHTVSGVTPYTRQKNYIKYPKTSQVYADVKNWISKVNPERLYLLTATPDAEPMKVYALAQILGANWDFFKFRDIFYFEQTGRGRTFYKPWRSTQNKELLGKMIKQLGYTGRLQDWFDVPDQTFKVHLCGTTSEQEQVFQDLKELYPDPLVLTGKVHQLEQGCVSHDKFDGEKKVKVIQYVAETKIEALERYQHEFGRIVVFAKYTAQINLYQKHFTKNGIKVFVLNGQIKDKDREQLTKLAELSSECVFIAQSSVSAGWELPSFPAMIFASLDHSFINYDQAIGRIQRANNIKKNIYIFLVAGIADKRVKKVVDEKLNFSEAKFAKEYGEEVLKSKKLA